jgi:hypothetical protein
MVEFGFCPILYNTVYKAFTSEIEVDCGTYIVLSLLF